MEWHIEQIYTDTLPVALSHFYAGLMDLQQETALFQVLVNIGIAFQLSPYIANRTRSLMDGHYVVSRKQYRDAGNPFLKEWESHTALMSGGMIC